MSGKNAFFPRNDRPCGLKRNAFQAEKALGSGELILAYAADGAGPVVRKLIEGNIVMLGGIIFVTAHAAYVLFHVTLLGDEMSVSEAPDRPPAFRKGFSPPAARQGRA